MFDGEKGVLRNKILPFGLNAIIAKVYKGDSWLDGKECIVLDYSDTSLVAHWIRDEIREIQPEHLSRQGLLGQAAADRLRSGVLSRRRKPVAGEPEDDAAVDLHGRGTDRRRQAQPSCARCWPAMNQRAGHGRSGRTRWCRSAASTACTSPASSCSTPPTADDIAVYGGRRRPGRRRSRSSATATARPQIVLVDELVAAGRPGPAPDLLALPGLRGRRTDLRRLDAARTTQRPTANYVNWIGRTVRQIREEAALRDGAGRPAASDARRWPSADAARVAARRAAGVRRAPSGSAGRLTPDAAERRRRCDWRVRNAGPR